MLLNSCQEEVLSDVDRILLHLNIVPDMQLLHITFYIEGLFCFVYFTLSLDERLYRYANL